MTCEQIRDQKFETRNPEFETFRALSLLSFEFVSDVDVRASDFPSRGPGFDIRISTFDNDMNNDYRTIQYAGGD